MKSEAVTRKLTFCLALDPAIASILILLPSFSSRTFTEFTTIISFFLYLGQRFALIGLKVVVSTFLRLFKVAVSQLSAKPIPSKYPETNIWYYTSITVALLKLFRIFWSFDCTSRKSNTLLAKVFWVSNNSGSDEAKKSESLLINFMNPKSRHLFLDAEFHSLRCVRIIINGAFHINPRTVKIEH